MVNKRKPLKSKWELSQLRAERASFVLIVASLIICFCALIYSSIYIFNFLQKLIARSVLQ